jgi:hypothetical protein
MAKCVLKSWVKQLTLQMQGTLLCAMRGPDGSAKNDPAKKLVRAFRAVLTHNALPLGPNNSFAGDGSGVPAPGDVHEFFASIDQYQHHWYMHFMHAAEIVGYCHPDQRIKNFWKDFYERCCWDAHVNPETKEQMLERLKGDGVQIDRDAY